MNADRPPVVPVGGTTPQGQPARGNSPASPVKPAVGLHIERLTLHGLGLPPGQSHRLQGAVERELGHLLGTRDAAARLSKSTASSSVAAQSIRIGDGGNMADLGRQIAEAIYRSLG